MHCVLCYELAVVISFAIHLPYQSDSLYYKLISYYIQNQQYREGYCIGNLKFGILWKMDSADWYLTLYYKYRQYPVKHLNAAFKNNQLKQIYLEIFNRLSNYFRINPRVYEITNYANVQPIKKQNITSHMFIPKQEPSFDFITSNNLNTSNPLIMSYSKRDGDSFFMDRTKCETRYCLQVAINLSEQILYLLLQKKDKDSKSNQENFKNTASLEMGVRRFTESEVSQADINTILDIGTQLNFSSQRNMLAKEIPAITIAKIPKDTEEINYFFMEFCSNITCSLNNSDQSLNSSISQSYSSSDIESGLSAQSLKSHIISPNKKSKQIISDDFDEFLLSVSSEQLKKTNAILKDKFFNFEEGGQFGINMLLQTWIQILLMKEDDEKASFTIIQQLIQDDKNPQINKYVEKISTYLHFITKMQTKRVMAESITKQNFISLIPQILDDCRTLDSLKLHRNGGFIQIIDKGINRNIGDNSQILKILLKKWKLIGSITSEVLCHDTDVFWAKTFHEGILLMDTLLMEIIEFSYSLLLLREKMTKQSRYLHEKTNNQYIKIVEKILVQEISSFWANQNQEQRVCKQTQRRFPLSRHTLGSLSNSSFLDQEFDKLFFTNKLKQCHQQARIIPELRQWESTIHSSIKRFRSFRLLLDTGIKIFAGKPECTIAFFVESYRSFSHLSILFDKNWVQVCEYCECMTRLVKNINQKMNQRGDTMQLKSKFVDQSCKEAELLPPQKYVKKTNWIKKKSNQQTPNTKDLNHIAFEIQFEAQKQNFYAFATKVIQKNQINTKLQNGKKQQNENCENDSSQSENCPIQASLDLMNFSIFETLLLRSKTLKGSAENSLTQLQQKIMLYINEHLRLVNLCNFAYNWDDRDLSNSGNKQEKGHKKIFFTTRELVKDLQDIEKQQKLYENKKISNSTSRRNNSNAKDTNTKNQVKLRHDRATLNVSFDHDQPNIKRKSSIALAIPKVQLSDIICEKIILKIAEHNKVLELLFLAYCKQNAYKNDINKILCQNSQTEQSSKLLQRQSLNLANFYMNFYRKSSLFKQNQVKSDQNNTNSESKSKLVEYQQFLQSKIQKFNLKKQLLLLTVFNTSLKIDTNTFNAIQSKHFISEQKMRKLRIVAKQYFSCLKNNIECLQNAKNIENYYLLQILPLICWLIELNFHKSSHVLIKNMGNVLNKYFSCYTQQIQLIQQKKTQQNEDMINLKKILGQIFQWNNNFNHQQIFTSFDLVSKILQLRKSEQISQLIPHISLLMEKQRQSLEEYATQKEKIEFMQYQVFYFMMRELYFNFKYDNALFEEKSGQAKSNYEIYECKILEFFQGVTLRDEEQFKLKKNEELKQRSAFLQGYLLSYDKEPEKSECLKNTIKKIVSMFDNFISVETERRKAEMKKRGKNNNGVILFQSTNKCPLYLHYVGTEYHRPNGSRTRVFDLSSYNLYKAIQIYESMLEQGSIEGERKYSNYQIDAKTFQGAQLILTLNKEDSQFVKKNREIIAALWINTEEKLIHERKMSLVRNAFLAKIQKLYIDLDVRHKVFEVFKDKILNYEMQKSKIYHQYMDYIRGLKLDVYCHVAGQNPIPYFKLFNVIKMYRMGIKKQELDEKVHQQFGKNLRKWNDGIQNDLAQYQNIIKIQEIYWTQIIQTCKKNRKQLFQINGIIQKQLKRQQSKQIVHHKKENAHKIGIYQPQISNKNNSSIKVRLISKPKSMHKLL